MPKYEVVKSPGVQFEVGYVFETDALHPSMAQFVKLVGRTGARATVKSVDPENDVDDVNDDNDLPKTYVDDVDEAYDLAYAELESRSKPAKPAKSPRQAGNTRKPDGPGENS